MVRLTLDWVTAGSTTVGLMDSGTGESVGGEQPPVDDTIITGLVLVPTATPTPAPPTPTSAEIAVVEPAATPTETPIPLPTATELPVETVPTIEEVAPPAEDAAALLPTPTPEPVEVAIVAATCPDPRSVITSPGVNQAVSGVIGVTGSATHETFQYYKLEYAPGANAGGGFVYFDGSDRQVSGGQLGSLNTTLLPNGFYTIQLIVVDGTGNFPPPCLVTIELQN